MEKIIKVENRWSARVLICDLCGRILKDAFYATIWVEKKRIFLEKYICEACYHSAYRKKRVIPIDKADKNIRAAIEENLQQEHYGFITSFNSWEELQTYIDNPKLIEKKGKKI